MDEFNLRSLRITLDSFRSSSVSSGLLYRFASFFFSATVIVCATPKWSHASNKLGTLRDLGILSSNLVSVAASI